MWFDKLRGLSRCAGVFRASSFWLIAAIVLVPICMALYKFTPLDLGGRRIASLSSRWTGSPLEWTAEGMTIAGGKQASVVFTHVELRKNTNYLFKITADASPVFHVDFYTVHYDSRDQEIDVPATRARQSFRRIINSGDSPPSCALRIHFLSDRPVNITRLELIEANQTSGLSYDGLRVVLLLVPLLALLAAIRRRRDAFITTLVFVAFSALYLAFSEYPSAAQGGDNMWYFPTAVSLIEDGDLDLGEHRDQIRRVKGFGILETRDGPINFFPIGTTLVSLPFAPVSQLLGFESRAAARILAALIAALSVAMVFLAAVKLGSSRRMAIAVALSFGLATSNLSLHAGGLWSHNCALAISLVIVNLLLSDRRWCVLLAAPLAALGYMTRPDFSIFIVGFTVYAIACHRDLAAGFILLVVLSLVPFFLWSQSTFGDLLPPYYHANRLQRSQSLSALAGQLFSPNRGLLVFNPVFVLSMIGITASWRRSSSGPPMFKVLASVCAAYIVVLTLFPHWWGGWTYGPRLYAPILGFLALLALPAVQLVGDAGRSVRIAVVTFAVIALAWGGFVHFKAVLTWDVHRWNEDPVSVDKAPRRIWDWRDMQIFR